MPEAVRINPWFGLGRFTAFLAVVVAVQLSSGAYQADLGNYSDEAAHFMNGLVLRDYLVDGMGQEPAAFARSYYLSYPKIAPLVWPPFFHAALALVLLPRWAPHAAALLLVAAFAAWTALRLSRFLDSIASPFAVRLVPLAFLATPLIMQLESAVMADIAVAATALEATWWLCRYVASQRLWHAVLFGIFAACCCLAKGNGMAIVLVPILFVALARTPELLKQRGLYLAGALVLVFAGPFVYISYEFAAAMGDFTAGSPSSAAGRMMFFATALTKQISVPATGLVMIGAASALRVRASDDLFATAARIGLIALAAAGILLHVGLPIQYPDARYVSMAIAPLMGLTAVGAEALASRMASPERASMVRAALLCAAAVALLINAEPIRRQSLGYDHVVSTLTPNRLAGERVLIVSDELGEGAFVSQVAVHEPNPRPILVRGSKLLIEQDWMHGPAVPLYTSAEQTLQNLKEWHIQYVVVDCSLEAQAVPYWSHIRSVLHDYPEDFDRLVSSTTAPVADGARTIEIYQLKHLPDGRAKDLPGMLGSQGLRGIGSKGI